MEDTRILVKNIEKRFEKFVESGVPFESEFLSLEEQSLLIRFVERNQSAGLFWYGGYAESERRKLVAMPDYYGISTEEELIAFFNENPDDAPLRIIDVTIPKQEKVSLSHRDYLGALMGEGVKREKIGDILVFEHGAQIIASKDMADYLSENLTSVGRAAVNCEIQPISALNSAQIRTEALRLNVASPRLDNIVSEVFKIARKDAQEAILRGLVFVNGIEVNKPDMTLKGREGDPRNVGEKVVLRGKGKAIYHGVSGFSKKGNSYIEVTKYI